MRLWQLPARALPVTLRPLGGETVISLVTASLTGTRTTPGREPGVQGLLRPHGRRHTAGTGLA